MFTSKGVIQFRKRGKLNPRYIGPFNILKRVGPVAYKLELPKELSSVYSTFYVANQKKCLSDESLIIPMKEIQLDDTLNFVEKPVEIMDREVKQLRQSRIPIFKEPTLDYFRVFGSKCFILNIKDYLTKFDPKSYESVFLGYSQNSKAYIILNKHTRKIEESLNVTLDETPPPSKTSPLVDDDLDEEEAIREIEKKNLENVVEDEALEIDEIVKLRNLGTIP
ncbi:hypothetical protein Tco_0267326 [Tanacetum coccineum]